ncbi:otoferlin [Diachasma alloeum]|uniref:otoferlin n=1 Tax=Diachasma alloeum TaxID=454923 RepID=UPI00073833F9|nr:otoferlin [Diachasma alloeum]
MFDRRKKGRYGAYQVAITILEARHLVQNANPMVVVKVGNQKKKTVVRDRTDCPYFDHYFVFDFTCEFEVLLSTRVSISVYLRNSLRQLKFHGGIFFEVATVWDQPGHEYYHKWAMLTNPKDSTGEPKGYVKCNISVNAKGERLRAHPDTDGDDDIEGNLLLPIGNFLSSSRQRARYVLTIYRADGLPSRESTFCIGNAKKLVNPYVQISFAGMKGETSSYKCTYTPRFNERIVFRELFPPLSHRVRIAVKDKVHGCNSTALATHMLNLARLSNSGEYGFLPTYGPSFIHLYGNDASGDECRCRGKCQTVRPIYRGRVLLSLKTEIDDPGMSGGAGVDVEPATPIMEKILWATEEYLLVGIIYDVCMIDRCRFLMKSVSFEINFGNAGSRVFPHNISNSDGLADDVILEQRVDFVSHTESRLTATTDGKFNYLPLGSSKPCMYVKSWWPNLEWRVSNTNSLMFIVNFLEDELAKLESLIAVENSTAYEAYNGIIGSLKRYCMQYLHILDAAKYDDDGGTTKLDRHRVNLCRECVESILRMIRVNGQLANNNYLRMAVIHAYKYLHKLREISKDHAFPDVFIWMIAGTRRVAMARLSACEIIYSEDETSRGSKCGQRINLFMKSSGDEEELSDYSACKIEIFLWLGNAKYSAACWSSIPSGYDVECITSAEPFPRILEYNVISKFQLRAHIFQGRFDPGMDSSGLMDPLIRVIFHGYTATTKYVKQSLAPVWDETLVLPPIELYGSTEDIKYRPPKVVMEAFDWDLCGSKEYCGRCIATPVVKLKDETYSPPEFPPTLAWHKLKTQRDFQGSILAAFELIETGDDEVVDVPLNASEEEKIYNLPDDVRPAMRSHRLEVIFWGVRDLRKINCTKVNKPRVVLECGGVFVRSEVMDNVKKFSNFEENHFMIDLDLPEKDIYYPPITIKVFDSRGFGCFKYAGVYIIPTAHIFLRKMIPEEDYISQIYGEHNSSSKRQSPTVVFPLPIDYDTEKDEKKGLISYKRISSENNHSGIRKLLTLLKPFIPNNKRDGKHENVNYGNDGDESYDWWSKYFASLEIYPMELELQPEFHEFQDRLMTFELSRGKRTGDPDYDQRNYSGKFKGQIAIYPWPHPDKLVCRTMSGHDASHGLLADYPSQAPVKLLVRLYVVKAINLHPSDPLTGKSDPYLRIKLGKSDINDKKNYIPNQLNPIFGKCFEIDAQFPKDHTLTIQVWDYDATSSDDLIGETRIDIENRYYSNHRGHCGISRTWSKSGYNAWRDRERPTQILETLCRRNNLPLPEFTDTVTIGKQKFPFTAGLEILDESGRNECMALNVLHQWQDFPVCGLALVPEHVERRSLFNARRPGLEQGKLELWIDMFHVDDLPPKPPVDITPQSPEVYELRVIVWNTEDVPLVDNQFLTGEKCSDIYVKGWMLYDDNQKTDVHYNSLNGEGNFNWRFVFRFTYSRSENLMVVRRKLSVLARDTTEQKLPCRLNIQVWDSDHFSQDDFLGSLTLDLSRMPRGSNSSKNCSLKVTDTKSPTVNLFKVMRTRAWWPFSCATSDGDYIQAGKVEMEMTIVPAAEADKEPVGKGREPPDPLPPPDRPDTSFSWFRNPWKACCFVVCRHYRWRIILCSSMFLIVMLLVCAIYAFPGYLVKKLLAV